MQRGNIKNLDVEAAKLATNLDAKKTLVVVVTDSGAACINEVNLGGMELLQIAQLLLEDCMAGGSDPFSKQVAAKDAEITRLNGVLNKTRASLGVADKTA